MKTLLRKLFFWDEPAKGAFLHATLVLAIPWSLSALLSWLTPLALMQKPGTDVIHGILWPYLAMFFGMPLAAPKIVEIYSRAFACLPELPKDQVQRDNLLSELVTEEISSLFDECDKQFYALEDNVDVDSVEYQFIINNKASFV